MCRKTFTGFYRLGTIAPDVCRPFDSDRKGILTGEGAGDAGAGDAWTRPWPAARGSTPRSSATGSTATPTTRSPRTRAASPGASTWRWQRSGVKPDEVDLVSAHGTGTRANDVTETTAHPRSVYGDDVPRTVSIKSMIGHTMGAASALGRRSPARWRIDAPVHPADDQPPEPPTPSARSTACPTTRIDGRAVRGAEQRPRLRRQQRRADARPGRTGVGGMTAAAVVRCRPSPRCRPAPACWPGSVRSAPSVRTSTNASPA